MNSNETDHKFEGKTRNTLLKVLLAFVCLSHLVLGGLAFVGPSESISAAIIKATYGATVDLTPALVHVIRIVGAFLIAIGVMAAFAFVDPMKNRAIIWGVIVLLVLRVSQRLIFASEIMEAFDVTTVRLLGQSAFFFAIAAALFFLLPKVSRSGVDAG